MADYPALQQDPDQRVTNQPRDRRANAVRKSAYIRRMLAGVNLAAQSFGAPWTRHSCIHPVVSSTQRLLAVLAEIAWRLRGILGRAELWRRIAETVTHRPEQYYSVQRQGQRIQIMVYWISEFIDSESALGSLFD